MPRTNQKLKNKNGAGALRAEGLDWIGKNKNETQFGHLFTHGGAQAAKKQINISMANQH
jgi:hypothetical protein